MTQKKSSAAFGWSVKNKIGLGRKRRQGETKSKTKLRFWKTQKVLFEEERGSEPVRFVQSWWDRPWDIGKQTVSLYGKKKKRKKNGDDCKDGRKWLFQLLYESKVWFVALVFLSTHTTGIAFSKFLFFMVCLISSFHYFLFDLPPKYKMKKDIHQV